MAENLTVTPYTPEQMGVLKGFDSRMRLYMLKLNMCNKIRQDPKIQNLHLRLKMIVFIFDMALPQNDTKEYASLVEIATHTESTIIRDARIEIRRVVNNHLSDFMERNYASV
ncbi:unnamed protein product [Caenorhabditis angaria]|uniref:Uncharacterized protein n=1 Tax=Caenorhabditis angaria TaxID=860376 RepID=A0A9P1J390_9PELO|nr:unnamed protein product [Caenorhabditis angaria]